MPLELPLLYPILDASILPAEDRAAYLARLIHDLEDAGIRLLQYRNKTGGEAEILTDAEAMKTAAASNLKLIMNDYPNLSVRARFDGVHVGQEDLSAAEARRIVGPDGMVGLSTHNRAQLEAAGQMPVDYIAIGPVFATSSKQNPDPVIGLEGVREARALTGKPLVAIGGITPENARAVLGAGADSVAVISAIFGRGIDSAKAAKEFFRDYSGERQQGISYSR